MTGGALGIGRAICEVFAAEGATVVITDVRDGEGAALSAALKRDGYDAVYLHLDTADEDEWEATVDHVVETCGRLDVLVNNAGIGGGSSLIQDTKLAEWRAVMAVNLDAVFLGCRQGIRAMAKTGSGSIVNISSILGLVSMPRTGAYTASKGGVRLLTKAAAVDCASAGLAIRVNSIHPGFTRTAQVEQRLASDDGAAFTARVEAATPLGSWGTPADVAEGVLYFASDASRFVTGSELVIDGGVTASV